MFDGGVGKVDVVLEVGVEVFIGEDDVVFLGEVGDVGYVG